MANKKSNKSESRPAISTGVGASDDSSGGGNASGVPDADTAMRPGDSLLLATLPGIGQSSSRTTRARLRSDGSAGQPAACVQSDTDTDATVWSGTAPAAEFLSAAAQTNIAWRATYLDRVETSFRGLLAWAECLRLFV